MTRFRPLVEALDARALPSATFTGVTYPSADLFVPAAVQGETADDTADQAGEFTEKKSGGKTGGSTMKIRLSDILIVHYESKAST